MKFTLENRVALVTGAGRRLGRETAIQLASLGMDVVIHCNTSVSEAEETAAAVTAAGRRTAVIAGDLADVDGIAGLFDRCAQALGPIGALINSASIFPRSGVLDFSAADLDRNMRINAMAPLALARCMAAQPEGAFAIVNLLDSHVGEYDRNHVPYHLSKRALDAITRMLAEELAPAIRVNAVAPD